jgi:hypothetical protein
MKVFGRSPNENFYFQIFGLIFLKIFWERCSLGALMDNPDNLFSFMYCLCILGDMVTV